MDIEPTRLMWAEPRPPPPGTALYFREYFSCHGPQVWHRAIATDAGELVWDNPLNELPRKSEKANWYPQLRGVSPGGGTLVAWVCDGGHCGSIEVPPSDDSEGVIESLWGSDDTGVTWQKWGEYPQGVRVSLVTEGDAAVHSLGSREPSRAWWFRSGEALEAPVGLRTPRIVGWGQSGQDSVPIWGEKDGTTFSASGAELPVPPDFGIAASLPDGSILWSSVDYRSEWVQPEPGQRDVFLHLDDQGSGLGAYSWDGRRSLIIVDHLWGQLFAGFLGTYTCKDTVQAVLVDFSTRTVHAVPGLDDASSFVIFAARAAPD